MSHPRRWQWFTACCVISVNVDDDGVCMFHTLLMHGTCLCRIAKIEAKGFLARTYLTNDEEIALYYAECASDECDCGGHGYLAVQVEAGELRADINSYEEPLSYFRDRYTRSDDEWYDMVSSGEVPSPENEFDYETSLCIVNSAVHVSAIAPAQVVSVAKWAKNAAVD